MIERLGQFLEAAQIEDEDELALVRGDVGDAARLFAAAELGGWPEIAAGHAEHAEHVVDDEPHRALDDLDQDPLHLLARLRSRRKREPSAQIDDGHDLGAVVGDAGKASGCVGE
jgi:hypothetical protein